MELFHSGFWGRTRSGKTTQLKQHLKGLPRYLIVDPDEEFGGLVDARLEIDGDTRADFLPMLNYLADHWGDFKLAIHPRKGVNYERWLDCLAALIFDLQDHYNNKPHAHVFPLIVDEMADFYPNKQNVCPNFWVLIRRGLKRGVYIMATSQRMADVSTGFRGNAAVDYFFAMQTVNDVDQAVQRLGREYQAALRQLENHQFLRRDLSGAVTPGANPKP